MRPSLWHVLRLLLLVILTEVEAHIRCYSCVWTQADASILAGCADRFALIHGKTSDEYTSEETCLRCIKSEIWEYGMLKSVFRSCALALPNPGSQTRRDNTCTEVEIDSKMQVSCVCDQDLCNHGNGRHNYTSKHRLLSFLRYVSAGVVTWFMTYLALRH